MAAGEQQPAAAAGDKPQQAVDGTGLGLGGRVITGQGLLHAFIVVYQQQPFPRLQGGQQRFFLAAGGQVSPFVPG